MAARWQRAAAWAGAASLSLAAAAQTAEDYLQHQWYRMEVALFEQIDENDRGAAVPRVIEAFRLPRLSIPLAGHAPPADAMLPFGAGLAVDDDVPLLFSNLAPPLWYAGKCAAESWRPERDGPRDDPCLPRRDIDLEATFPDDPFAARGERRKADEQAPAELEADPARLALEALAAAVEEHERQLTETSYVWRRQTPALASALRRLRRGRTVLAAGSWHQALPPRDAPQPLLVQAGMPDAMQRFRLEGWFSVTVGRYVHLRAHLLYRLAEGGVAVLSESRRMGSRELHYLDHPALGILAVVQPLDVPSAIERLVDDYRLAAGR